MPSSARRSPDTAYGEDGRGRVSRIVALARASGQSPPHGGNYSALGNERAKPLAFPPIRKRSRSGSHNRNAAQATAPLHGATPTNGVRAQLCASAHRARRDASVPAGQSKNAPPSRSVAGKSATSENPAHFPALLIVTGTARTSGLVRESG